MTEMVHDARIVPLDGRGHVDEDLQFWSGDSRGYWEDDTLVVVTNPLNKGGNAAEVRLRARP